MTSLQTQMEAYAFRQLVEHLQWRTDVQNIDLMNLAGFCRNCLAKWYHAGGKVYGVPLEYAEACERVYGEPYPQWKKKHQKPATEEQMAIFNGDSARHARTEPGAAVLPQGSAAAAPEGGGHGHSHGHSHGGDHSHGQAHGQPGGHGGHSSVCCKHSDDPPPEAVIDPGMKAVQARVAILTCSDRASRGEYEDLSGPAAAAALRAFAERSGALAPTVVQQKVVPDDQEAIFEQLRQWSQEGGCDLILTTGGTGLGPRDVTPEATRRVIARPAEGLSRAMAWQTSFLEPHSILSRGTCGVTVQEVLVVNMPGNPNAVRQCLSVLLPVLPHALQMLKS